MMQTNAFALEKGNYVKKWKCTVCGYIHEGDEPPEKCPVCGADRSKFIELVSEEQMQTKDALKEAEHTKMDTETENAVFSSKYDRIYDFMVKHHVHPISVHIPNGVLPVSVLFIFLAVLFNFNGLGQAAFYNLICVVFSMPVVLFSGYIEWRKKYNAGLTKLFLTKMTCAGVVSLTAIVLVVWFFIDPQAANPASSHKGAFLFVNLVMLSAAVTAGFIGGKLVFKD